MELLSILGLCITATVFGILLREYRSEYAVGISVVTGVIILFKLLDGTVGEIFEFRDLIVDSGVKSAYFSVAVKALGICLVTGFVSDVCKDFGQNAIGNFAVGAGKCAIFVMSVPLLSELLRAATEFIG